MDAAKADIKKAKTAVKDRGEAVSLMEPPFMEYPDREV